MRVTGGVTPPAELLKILCLFRHLTPVARKVEIQIDESQIGCDVLAGNALAFNRLVSTCFRAVAHAVETIRSPETFPLGRAW